jgi:hypothetical protein
MPCAVGELRGTQNGAARKGTADVNHLARSLVSNWDVCLSGRSL